MIREPRATSVVEALKVRAVRGSRAVAVVDVNTRERVLKLWKRFRLIRDENL